MKKIIIKLIRNIYIFLKNILILNDSFKQDLLDVKLAFKQLKKEIKDCLNYTKEKE